MPKHHKPHKPHATSPILVPLPAPISGAPIPLILLPRTRTRTRTSSSPTTISPTTPLDPIATPSDPIPPTHLHHLSRQILADQSALHRLRAELHAGITARVASLHAEVPSEVESYLAALDEDRRLLHAHAAQVYRRHEVMREEVAGVLAGVWRAAGAGDRVRRGGGWKEGRRGVGRWWEGREEKAGKWEEGENDEKGGKDGKGGKFEEGGKAGKGENWGDDGKGGYDDTFERCVDQLKDGRLQVVQLAKRSVDVADAKAGMLAGELERLSKEEQEQVENVLRWREGVMAEEAGRFGRNGGVDDK